MSYSISVRVIQSKPLAWFRIVEKTAFYYGNGATWAEVDDGEQVLSMGSSGTSGTLRFMNPQGEYFLVALGVHNNKRWCDIAVDLPSSSTGVEIHPTYYIDNSTRNAMLWKQLASLQATSSSGVKISVDYYVDEGKTLKATITIS
ncbi:hypothetical protein L7F22_053055 [Adiantum nelumboides]|nr:hypothetical protein [Adiantum nelumboides]MCO5598952.1 hypothetical protein [Adiantum nelumboides]MCO5598953.1 hypothetical protein [Adiantum nelumboides]MCO5598954.1 hypothetical protein [Adiantum nelumboides]MCO5598955.1 hypothetical protein [Adiantum nelumboides]